MGIYLNPDNAAFTEAVCSKIYVDKTDLIAYTNEVLATAQKNICVSRPRRFGKSMTANMLAAYYSCGCNSEKLFSGLNIYSNPDFSKYLNQYHVIFLNIQEFLSRSKDVDQLIERIQHFVMRDIKRQYPDMSFYNENDLVENMKELYAEKKCPFIIIIDEWDCIFREYETDKAAQEHYLDFLRDFLKDKPHIHLAYMTGILPIKKYGTHSALNMFDEFSMANPGILAQYVGFTEEEVTELCAKYNMNLPEIKEWYDGYRFEKVSSIYSPRSVVASMLSGICDSYWNQTESFEALREYIDLNFDGLKDAVLRMMAGETVSVNTGSFGNDMTTFHNRDDVLTLLIHLGYLGYDFSHKSVFIPNNEIRGEYVNAVSVSQWGEVSIALKNSSELLHALWNKDTGRVADYIEQAHLETSHLQYNDENALSYTISLALYAARNFYNVYREFPSGKGFADLVYIPKKKFSDKPALVVELKWDQSAQGAINQIMEKNYCNSLREFQGNLLLVGINYDKKTRQHTCVIHEYPFF